MTKQTKHLLEFGPFRVDPEQRRLLRDGQPISLSSKAFDLLLVLMERSGQVVPKDDLMRLLWPNTFVEESNLGQHVFQLRKALGERPQDHSFIVTVPGQGYRFVQRVRALPENEILVVAHHSQARVVIEGNEKPGLGTESPWLPDRERLTVPPALPRWSGIRIAGLVLLAAMFAAITVWIFARPAAEPTLVRALQLTQTGRVEPYRPPLS